MRHPLHALLTLAVLAAVIAVPTFVSADDDDDDLGCLAPPAPLTFEDRVFIDTTRAGGEPVAVTAFDGSLSVSAHAGTTHFQPDAAAVPGTSDFAVGYTNQTLNWRSEDGGRSWEYVGLAGTGAGPHSLTSTGFSDPDYAIDQAGTIYNVEIDLANNAVFSSRDDGQSYLLANPEVFPGDRPWLAANEADEVFLYVNLPRTLLRSRDGGITWTVLPSPPINGKPITDPLNPDDGLIGPIGGGIAISADDGDSWTSYRAPALPASRAITTSIAADAAGNVYTAGAVGYRNENDTTPDGSVGFAHFDRATMTWGDVTPLDVPEGDMLWPWIVAGDDGRAAFTWLQTIVDPVTGDYEADEFYAMAAVTTNGVGTDCDGDGTADVDPQFSVAVASGTPVHLGKICSGTGCNLSNGGDRRIGDFSSLQFDHEGRVFIVSGDTTLTSPTGGPKPVANPIFIGAADGSPLLLEQPRDLRPTRCLEPLGATPLCEAGE